MAGWAEIHTLYPLVLFMVAVAPYPVAMLSVALMEEPAEETEG
jgi:hypothetical protein